MRDQDKGKHSAPRWNFWGGQSSAVDRELEGHHSWDHAVVFFQELISAIVSQLDPARNRSGDFNPLIKFTWVCNGGKHRSRKIATYIRALAQQKSFSDPLPGPCRFQFPLRITLGGGLELQTLVSSLRPENRDFRFLILHYPAEAPVEGLSWRSLRCVRFCGEPLVAPAHHGHRAHVRSSSAPRSRSFQSAAPANPLDEQTQSHTGSQEHGHTAFRERLQSIS